MSRTKLLLDVVSDMRSLADSLETMANAVAGNDGVSKEKQADKPSVLTHLVQHFLQEHFRVHRKSVQWKSLMNLKKRNVQHTAVQSVTLALTATLTAV